jgi:hypothetical protein
MARRLPPESEDDELLRLDPQAVGAMIAGFIVAGIAEGENTMSDFKTEPPAEPPATTDATDDATARRPGTSWRPGGIRPPAEPVRPSPPTGVGPIVEVRSKNDLRDMKSGYTYQWVGGFKLREQLAMEGLKGVTLVDPWIEQAYESNIYARNFTDLTILNGNLHRSKTKSGLLTDGDCQGLRVYGTQADENEEHGFYYGAHKKNGTPFIFEDCIGRRNHRCGIQINLEGRNWWVVGGHILRCTWDGNASEQGSQCNLGGWDRGLFKDCTVINGQDDGVILCAVDGKASKTCRVESTFFKNNRDAPLKTADGSKGHTLSKCTFDEMPTMAGIRSDKTNLCNGKKF